MAGHCSLQMMRWWWDLQQLNTFTTWELGTCTSQLPCSRTHCNFKLT